MSFFKRKKNKKINVTTISPQVLIRKIIYDSGCVNPELVAAAMGLSPISQEVADMEIQASSERLGRIQALLPILEAHSVIAGQVAVATYAAGLVEDDMPELSEELLGSLLTIFRYVSFSSILTCLSALVEMNVLSERGK